MMLEATHMNSMRQAISAYDTSVSAVRTARATELDVFRRVTSKLRSSDPKTDFVGFCRALQDNRQLWTLLAIDVADPDNGLSSDLRAQIFYLAEFVDLQTSKIIAGGAEVAILIDVNLSVMRGLHAKVDTK